MNDKRDPDIYEIDYQSGNNERCPNLFDVEAAVLAQLVVKGRRDVLEGNDLLLCESSDRDLEDRDASVADERKAYDEICERDLEIDRVEGDEEA